MKNIPQNCDAKSAFDALRRQTIELSEASVEDGARVLFIDETGKQTASASLSRLLQTDVETREGDLRSEIEGIAKSSSHPQPSADLGDSLSILRFVRGNKSKRLEISPSGKSRCPLLSLL